MQLVTEPTWPFDPAAAEASPPAAASWRWGALLVVLVAVAYLPAFNAGFVWQDDVHVTHNPLLRTTDGLWRTWTDLTAAPRFQPLTYTIFWLERQLWGDGPLGYHIVSIAFHAANVLLLWVLARRLEVPFAWFAAAIFAVHPIQVGSVAWVSQFGGVLSAFFCLTALLGYLGWSGAAAAPEVWEERARFVGLPQRPAPRYVVTFMLVTAACLCHPVAATWPLCAVLIHRWRSGRIIVDRGSWPLLSLLPFALICVASSVAALTIGGTAPVSPSAPALTPIQTAWAAIGTVWLTLAGFVLPLPSVMAEAGWPFAPRTALEILFPFGIIAVAVPLVGLVLWQWHRVFEGGATVGWTLFALLCIAGAIPLGHGTTYLSVGCLAVATPATIVFVVKSVIPKSGPTRRLALSSVLGRSWLGRSSRVAAVVVLSGWTVLATKAFADEEAFWRDQISARPKSSRLHVRLAGALQRTGRLNAAEQHLVAATRLAPTSTDVWLKLGRVHEALRRLDDAVEDYRVANRLDPQHPAPYEHLGDVLTQRGRPDTAYLAYQRAAYLATVGPPASRHLHVKIAGLLLKQGKLDEALSHYDQAIKGDPASAVPHLGLSNVYFAQGHYVEAVDHANRAMQLAPNDAGVFRSVGMMCARSGEHAKAQEFFRQAASIRPDDAITMNNLGVSLASQGRLSEAAFYFDQAASLSPQANEVASNVRAAQSGLVQSDLNPRKYEADGP